MYWKLSIDLSHPTVTSMGNLDPYDGLVTCTLLQQAAAATAAAVVSDAAHSQVQEQVQHHGDDGVGGGQGLSAGRDQQQGFTGRVLQAEIADLQAMVDARYMRYEELHLCVCLFTCVCVHVHVCMCACVCVRACVPRPSTQLGWATLLTSTMPAAVDDMLLSSGQYSEASLSFALCPPLQLPV